MLSVPVERLDDAASPATIDTWDSFNALLIVSELEREFNISFTIEEVTEVKCVGDIRTALARHNFVLDS